MEKYHLDPYLEDMLDVLLPTTKAVNIKDIITILNEWNNNPNTNYIANLSELEEDILDTITETEDEGYDAIRDYIDVKFYNQFLDYLKDIGIIVTTEDTIPYAILRDIFYSVNLLFTLEIDTLEEILNSIDNNHNEDIVDVVSNILADYVTTSNLDLYTYIEDVNSNLINEVRVYYTHSVYLNNPQPDTEVYQIVHKLYSVDNTFLRTKFLSMVINEGYTMDIITNNLTKLYNNLETYKEEDYLIPYEAAAVLFLSEDTKDNPLAGLKEYIDLDAVSYIHNNTHVLDATTELTQGLISKVTGNV